MPRLPISSAGMRLASPGSRSRAGTSWLTTTGRCSRNWNDSWRKGWVQASTLSTAAPSRCCPIQASSSRLSVPPQRPSKDHPPELDGRRGCPSIKTRPDERRCIAEKRAVRRRDTQTQHLESYATDSSDFPRIRGIEQGSQAAGIQFCRPDGRVCVHAGGWIGERSPRQLLPLSGNPEVGQCKLNSEQSLRVNMALRKKY